MTGQYNSQADWLTPKEAAAFLGVSVRTVYSWVERGELESTRDNRSVRINRADVEVLQQRKNIRKVAGEIINEAEPGTTAPRKGEINSAVFVALAGLQSERQQLHKQLSEIQLKMTEEAYEKGQLEEKLQLMAEMEEVIRFVRTENTHLQDNNKKLTTLLTILGIVLIVLVFMLLICVIVIIK